MSLDIKQGAFFVADAHYSSKKPLLLEFLNLVKNAAHKPPQIFFMGDTFDFLSAHATASITESKPAIDRINTLSRDIEIILLEGNHDFNLRPLFPHCKVYERKKQPLRIKTNGTAVEIAHGDRHMGAFYEAYRRLVEQSFLLKPLNFIDQKQQKKISKKIFNHLETKKLCKDLPSFDKIITSRLAKSSASVLIEGHLHQDGVHEKNGKKYVATPALICKKSFFVVESLENGLAFVPKNMKEIGCPVL